MQILYSINKTADIGIYNTLTNQNYSEEDLIVNPFGKFYRFNKGVDDFYYVKNFNANKVLSLNEFKEISEFEKRGYKVFFDKNFNVQNVVFLCKETGLLHIVQPTQTLTEIAKKYNISTLELIKNNNLKTEKLFIGQLLYI